MQREKKSLEALGGVIQGFVLNELSYSCFGESSLVFFFPRSQSNLSWKEVSFPVHRNKDF